MADAGHARLVALDRRVIEELAQAKLDEAHALLGLLDRFDGDPDTEDGDPDRALDEGEPDFAAYHGEGSGCEISDPGGCQHDGREPDEGC
ncbi:MAG: hypothetical protein Q8R44_09190 [Novosphingobium sp.]|nr:hypothetical protein [Novosphingobium sp.]